MPFLDRFISVMLDLGSQIAEYVNGICATHRAFDPDTTPAHGHL